MWVYFSKKLKKYLSLTYSHCTLDSHAWVQGYTENCSPVWMFICSSRHLTFLYNARVAPPPHLPLPHPPTQELRRKENREKAPWWGRPTDKSHVVCLGVVIKLYLICIKLGVYSQVMHVVLLILYFACHGLMPTLKKMSPGTWHLTIHEQEVIW